MRCPVVMSVDGTIACDGTGGPVTDARLPLTTRILLRGPLVGLEDCCARSMNRSERDRWCL